MPRFLSLCVVVCLTAPAIAQHRVMVQEVHGRDTSLQTTTDGKLAWIMGGVSEHILNVFDPNKALALRRFYFPDRIESVSVDPGTHRIAVSTRSGIYFGRLTDDELEEILPGVHGAILLNDGAKLLAVLGGVPDPKRKERRTFGHDERTLGVYDLDKKEWLHVQHTPIVSPYLLSVNTGGPPALLFHKDELLAGGIGGTLGSMIPVTFSADVRLNLTTGKAKITTGPSSRRGEVITPGTKMDSPGETPILNPFEGAEYKHDPSYASPELLKKASESAESLRGKVRERKALSTLLLDAPYRDAPPMPFVAEADRVQMAVPRYVRLADGFRSKTTTVRINRDGKLDFGPTRDLTDNPFARGNINSLRIESYHVDISDLFTGKPLVPKALIESKGEKDAYFIDRVGTLVQQDDKLTLYKPGKDQPEWTRKSKKRNRIEVQLDAARKIMAFTCGDEPILAEIIRVSDGELLGTIPRPKDITDNYMDMALSLDGKRFGVMKREEMRILDALTGKPLESHRIDEDTYSRGLESWSGGWLVSSEAKSQVFDDRVKKFTTIIPFAGVVKMEEVDTPKGKRFVLQGYTGLCCLADPTDGTILSRWIAAEYGRLAQHWNAVFAGGKALLRPTGWTATLEVVDLRDSKVMLTIHTVPVGKELGHITYTPDGWWDATPGAERFVALFEKGVRVSEETRDGRRNAKVIQERVAGLWK